MRFCEQSSPDGKKLGAKAAGGRKWNCIMGTEFQICKIKRSGDLFHNNVNTLNTKLYTQIWLKGKFYIVFFTVFKNVILIVFLTTSKYAP